MFKLTQTPIPYYRYISLLAIVILGVMSLLGSGGGAPPPSPPTGPSIIAVLPSASSDTALVTTVVAAQFDTAMDNSTIDNPEQNFFVIDDLTGNIVPGSVEYHPTYEIVHNYVAVFTASNDLDTGRSYTATVTTDVKDNSGNSLARDYVWSFSIAPSPVPVSTDATGRFGSSGIDINSSSMPNATGEYVVFASTDDLAGPGTNSYSQIYRKNMITRGVELVSISSNNQNIANGNCAAPRISDTGRYIVFSSTANNLDPSITLPSTGISHIYLKDMRDGTISLLDKSTTPGQAGNNNSYKPDISGIPDTGSGKYVVFESTATDLHVNDADDTSDIFLINVVSGNIDLISVDSNEVKGNAASIAPRVSENGRRIVFESIATNLVADDTNTKSDIFLRNFGSNSTTSTDDDTLRLSVSTLGNEVTGGPIGSTNADISSNGASAVFQSDQHLDGDTNGNITDIFLRSIDVPSTAILSFAEDGTDADNDSTSPSIGGDGRYVAFESLATTLLGVDLNNIGIDTNGQSDIFVRDKNSSKISRVSTDLNNAQVNGTSTTSVISADARYVSFTSPYAFDGSDGNGVADIYRAYNSTLP